MNINRCNFQLIKGCRPGKTARYSCSIILGLNGPGGCYGFGYTCSAGLICANSQSVCPKGELLHFIRISFKLILLFVGRGR